MKLRLLLLTAMVTLLYLHGKAQEVTLKTEYLGKSGYYYLPPGEEPTEKIGDAKGSSMVYQASANIPLFMELNEKNRPTAWGIGFGGAYVSLKNQNFSEQMVSEIMNFQFGIYHLRPLNDKWSMRASLGLGIFTPSTDFSKISFKNILGSGSAVFIRHLNPNLSIGGGVAINSTLGYPMLFPAVYVKWKTEGKFDLKVELVDGLEVSAGYDLNDKFKLSYALEMNGQVALLKKDRKDVIFSHQYIVTGFRPEYKISENLSVTGMTGLNLYRPASYSDRTLKGVFASDNDFYFTVSPYASAGLKLKF
ncbi:MAG: histidine kinase [Chryseobacterium sp.]|nr:MAG: histidine kinase [Chryseobacterium sp.]